MDDNIIDEYHKRGRDCVCTGLFVSETIKVMINIFQLLNCFRHGQRWHVEVLRANNLNSNDNVLVMPDKKGIQRQTVKSINQKSHISCLDLFTIFKEEFESECLRTI